MAAERKASSEQFSVELSNVLDIIGYSKEHINNGQRFAQQMQDTLNHEHRDDDFTVFLAGSKKEGMSFLELNSDVDLMFIFDKITCFQSNAEDDRSRSPGNTYVLDFMEVPPGYAMLEIDELSRDFNEELHVYSIESNKTYFSSERISSVMSTLIKSELGFEKAEETGPVPRKHAMSQLQKYTNTLKGLNAVKRHLSSKGLNDVQETASSENNSRQFRPNESAMLDDETCFGRSYVEIESRNCLQDEHERAEMITVTGHQIETNEIEAAQSNSSVHLKHGLSDSSDGKSYAMQIDVRDISNAKPVRKAKEEVIYHRTKRVINSEKAADQPIIPSQFSENESNKNVHSNNPGGRDKGQSQKLIKSINQTGPSQATQYTQPFDKFVSQGTDQPTIPSQVPAKELNKNLSPQNPDGNDKGRPQTLIKSISQTGPSQATQYKQPLNEFVSQDNVIAFPAQCENLKKLWCSRTRFNGFPSTNQIEMISKMDAHVVPVGCKKSEGADLQWRICFTFGEIELLQSLNGTQYKLYALLKYLAKEVIKPICSGVITSYVMKNVVLWMAELKPMFFFTEGRLEQCLTESVHFLYMCLTNGFMPNYMIDSRNLFQNRLSLKKEWKLRSLLKTLVAEGGSMVLRCDKIRLNMMSPYNKHFYGKTESMSRMCSDVFGMFYNPVVQGSFDDMESVFGLIISSIERSFADKPILVKLQSMVVLKYVDTWITELPDKSPERMPVRSRLRQQCLDLRKRISVSFALDFISNPTYRQLMTSIASLQVANVRQERVDNFLASEEFVNDMAEKFLKVADYLGVIDERKTAELMLNPMQMIQSISGGSRSRPSTTKKRKECVDLDLD